MTTCFLHWVTAEPFTNGVYYRRKEFALRASNIPSQKKNYSASLEYLESEMVKLCI